MYLQLGEEGQVAKQLQAFWELESLSIANEKPQAQEDIEALKRFSETITFKGGHYEVELPWRRDLPDLKDNYFVAKKRLEI